MTFSALLGFERFMDVLFLCHLFLCCGMALQAELPRFFDLHKIMFRGMGAMTAQASALLERRMPFPCHRFFEQIRMAGQTQLPAGCGFDKKGFLAPLVRVMTPAAFPGGKRPVQAEPGKLFIDLLMTPDTDLAIALEKQTLFFRLMGGVTGGAFILRRGRMAALPSPVLLPGMTLCTQLGRLCLQAGIFTLTVPEVTGQTIAFFHRSMHTLHRTFFALRMAFQAQGCRGHNQQGRFAAGMNTMTLRALAFLHRLMLPNEHGLVLFMALDTERIRLLRGLDKVRPGSVMAALTLTGNNRLMHYCFQQALAVAGMRVMAAQTVPFQQIPLVRFAHGFLAALVALETKAVRLLHQQAGLLALVGSVTGSTSLTEWGMDIFFLKKGAIMASVAQLFLFLQQQAGMGGIMACVTGGTIPLFHRLVAGNRARIRRHGLMAAQTQLRFFLP